MKINLSSLMSLIEEKEKTIHIIILFTKRTRL